MTAILKVPGDGGCCNCGNQSGCNCQKCAKLECRSRGGVVTLCGFDEFEDYISTPPKFYLDKAIGGSVVICDYHSPGGKGPCHDDGCVSPVGWSIEVANAWQCGGEGPGCTGTNLGGTAKVMVVDSYPTPGNPANVTLEFSGFANGSGCSTATFSWIGTINGSIFIGSYSGPGSSTAKVSRPNGDELGMALTLDSGCSADVAVCSGTVCTGEGGSVCVSECVDSGSAASADFSGLQWCVPTATSTRYQYSGKATIDPSVDCYEPVTDTRKVEVISHDLGCNPPVTGGTIISTSDAFDPELAAYVSESELNSGSYRGQTSNTSCSSDKRATACDRFEQLQSEDTDEDALARLLASPAGAWSEWQIVDDGTNGTCINPACCRAAWEIRTYRTFTYREAEWRATQNGLTPGSSVTIKISVWRKAFGPGPYDLLQEEEYEETADGEGVATAEGTVVNDEGFETYVTCTYSQP